MDELTELLLSRGAAMVGFADLTVLGDRASACGPRAVAIAVALDPGVIAGIADGPTESYSAEYDRANTLLNELANGAARFLGVRGFRASTPPATVQGLSPDNLRATFQHKTAATLAGLGWIGKCSLLITDAYGSAVRLATVLTDAPLATGSPVTESRCGDCAACVDICPAGACLGGLWRQGAPPEDLCDAVACYEGMKRVARARATHDDICGMCIAACPWTRSYLARQGAIGPQTPPAGDADETRDAE